MICVEEIMANNKNSVLKRPAELTPHIIIITSTVFLTLFVTDRFNGAMNFIAHDLTEKMIITCALIYVYQTVVFILDFGSKRRLLSLLLLCALSAFIAVYLLMICVRDLNVDASRLMLLEYNKFLLMIYSLLSVASSVRVIMVQRAYKMSCNRRSGRNYNIK